MFTNLIGKPTFWVFYLILKKKLEPDHLVFPVFLEKEMNSLRDACFLI